MRLLIQRVTEAKVVIDGNVHAKIEQGIVAFIGIHKGDTAKLCAPLAEKLANLRIFTDLEGKINLSVKDVQGSLLIVSQFTLYADCSKGRRPSFTDAASPGEANALYEEFIAAVKSQHDQVHTGVFGADMKVHLVNDGPLTFIVEI